MDLDKQGIFAQPAAEKESSDVVSCFFHCLQNMKRTQLNPDHEKGDESGHKMANGATELVAS